jgi:PAS domain S-box-containing protein
MNVILKTRLITWPGLLFFLIAIVLSITGYWHHQRLITKVDKQEQATIKLLAHFYAHQVAMINTIDDQQQRDQQLKQLVNTLLKKTQPQDYPTFNGIQIDINGKPFIARLPTTIGLVAEAIILPTQDINSIVSLRLYYSGLFFQQFSAEIKAISIQWFCSLLIALACIWLVAIRLFAPLKNLAIALRCWNDSNQSLPPLSKFVNNEIRCMYEAIHHLVTILQKERHLLTTVDDGICQFDREGYITFINPVGAQMLGWSVTELLGKKIHDAVYDHRQEAHQIYTAIDDHQTHFIDNDVFCHRDRTCFPVEYTTTPIHDNGLLQGAVVVFRDIQERRHMEEHIQQAMEKAEAAAQAKSNFLANMSHEIRTPMNAIIGLCHLAIQTELNTKQRDYLDKIQSSAHSLLGIIDDILDFSKIEAGKLTLEAVPFNLDDVLNNVANFMTVKLQDRDVEVNFFVDRGVPLKLVGDPLRLGQILLNLTNNAIKFTTQGNIILSIHLETLADCRVVLLFKVTDTGIGMNHEQVNRLFNAFSQADNSTTRQFGGTGLGLSICKNLVTLMDGTIWVDSTPGIGSTFHFTATFAREDNDRRRLRLPSDDLVGLKVLVVDTNPVARDILQRTLESFSFQTECAASWPEALATLEHAFYTKSPFKILFLEHKKETIAALSSSEALHRLMQHEDGLKWVTITAKPWQENASSAQHNLTKPVLLTTIFNTILDMTNLFCHQKSASDEHRQPAIVDFSALRGTHILVVEDNELNQQIAYELLTAGGIDVHIATTGQEALAAIQTTSFDAVLMDIQMPIMDGYTVTHIIRNELAQTTIPIIAMTASAMVGDREKCLAAGMNEYISKPIDPSVLFKTLCHFLQHDSLAAPQPVQHVDCDHEPIILPDNKADYTALELLDQCPEIDIHYGLKNLNGHHQAYLKLLQNSYTRYHDIAQRLHNTLVNGHRDEAQRLIHSFKGVMATIGAKQLHEHSQAVELFINQHDLEPEKIDLDGFQTRVQQTMTAIQSLLSQTPHQQHIDKNKNDPPLPQEPLHETLQRLYQYLNDGDATARDIIDDLKTMTTSLTLSQDLKQLQSQIDDYEFDAARQTCLRLLTLSGVHQKTTSPQQ